MIGSLGEPLQSIMAPRVMASEPPLSLAMTVPASMLMVPPGSTKT